MANLSAVADLTQALPDAGIDRIYEAVDGTLRLEVSGEIVYALHENERGGH